MAFMLIGLLLIGVSVFAGDDGGEVAAGPTGSTTTVPRSAALVGIAPGTTAPVPSGEIGVGEAPEVLGRRPLPGFGEVQATIRSGNGEVCEVCLLSAISPEQRRRGLMEVTDTSLGGYDGMLFEFPEEVEGGFWMRNTPMPLSIAFADGVGEVISVLDMAPCGDVEGCPTYAPDGAFRYAIEVPQGRFPEIDVAVGSTITITGRTCQLAVDGS